MLFIKEQFLDFSGKIIFKYLIYKYIKIKNSYNDLTI